MSLSGIVSALLHSPRLPPSWLSESDFFVEHFPDPPTKLSAFLQILVATFKQDGLKMKKNQKSHQVPF